ncbi:hypothetical protein PCCS19_43580 [Paenibacillus sp. CCS19]|uniref:hypothetical protein n=1 Tax=Paenibacillus sp. CCS19 TaxID=3158387 RepID=UPI00255E3159|nr:hypothetical protein [Paenibacillus cellulosilyticus]GMK41302.1 hypothetical protein PCCS19_43580 [Paenibacillus cellulosilyticus]
MLVKLMKSIVALTLLVTTAATPTFAATKTSSITVKFVSAELIENNSVGNEWETEGFVNNKALSEGMSVTLKLKTTDSLKIKVTASELDKIPDIGSANLTVKASTISKKTTKSLKVIVKENRGRYSGNTAEWKFTFEISKASS